MLYNKEHVHVEQLTQTELVKLVAELLEHLKVYPVRGKNRYDETEIKLYNKGEDYQD